MSRMDVTVYDSQGDLYGFEAFEEYLFHLVIFMYCDLLNTNLIVSKR